MRVRADGRASPATPRVYGLETEHDGTQPASGARIDLAARIHAAMLEGRDRVLTTSASTPNSEWTSRKIDMATNVDGDDFRRRVRTAANRSRPTPPENKGRDLIVLSY